MKINLRITDYSAASAATPTQAVVTEDKPFLQAVQELLQLSHPELKNFKADTAYRGKANECRCGCSSKYFAPGTIGYKRIMNDFNKIIAEASQNASSFIPEPLVDIWPSDYCIDLTYPTGKFSRNLRCITLYFHKQSA